MEFQNTLTEFDIDPKLYFNKAVSLAKKYGVNYKSLNFSKAKGKKLSILDDNNRIVNFGSSTNGDFIIWSILEKRKQVPKGYASTKQNVFWKSHTAMKYDEKNVYSPNNLSLNILWT